MCLQKVVLQSIEPFFVRCTIAINHVPTCSRYKSKLSGFKFCSADKELCSDQGELEYRYVKDNCMFEAYIALSMLEGIGLVRRRSGESLGFSVTLKNRPAAWLMTIAIEKAQQYFEKLQKLGIFHSKLIGQDSFKLVKGS